MKPDNIVNYGLHQPETSSLDERMTHIRDLVNLSSEVTNDVERERLENALRLEQIFARRNRHPSGQSM